MFHRTLRENIAGIIGMPARVNIRDDRPVCQAAEAAHVTGSSSMPDGRCGRAGRRCPAGAQRGRPRGDPARRRRSPCSRRRPARRGLRSEQGLVQRSPVRAAAQRAAGSRWRPHRLTHRRPDGTESSSCSTAAGIIEQGTHGELLDLGGTYARLWQHQSGGFLNEGAVPPRCSQQQVSAARPLAALPVRIPTPAAAAGSAKRPRGTAAPSPGRAARGPGRGAGARRSPCGASAGCAAGTTRPSASIRPAHALGAGSATRSAGSRSRAR